MLQSRQTYLGSEDIGRFSHKYKNFFDCHNSFTLRQPYRNLSVRSCLAATPLHTFYYFKFSFNNHLIETNLPRSGTIMRVTALLQVLLLLALAAVVSFLLCVKAFSNF
jgi:hypothetical protein